MNSFRPVVMITGGGSGIGAAFARRFAAKGTDLVLVGRDKARLEAAAAQHRRQDGVDVEVLAADLTDPLDLARVERRLGDPDRAPVSVLINNAGTRAATAFTATTTEALQSEMDLNITAVWRLTRAALPGMVGRGKGTIINIASIGGFLAPAGSSYGAAKAWMVAFTDTMAATLSGTGVAMIVSCPGYVRTDWHQRFGRPLGSPWSPFWCEPDQLVQRCLSDLERDRVISAPRLVHRAIIAFLTLPRTALRLGSRLAMRGR